MSWTNEMINEGITTIIQRRGSSGHSTQYIKTENAHPYKDWRIKQINKIIQYRGRSRHTTRHIKVENPHPFKDWRNRLKIIINHDKVPGDVVHFPLYLLLSSETGMTRVFDEVGANCKKIAVTMADGVTQLYVEIDRWHYETRKAHLWVSREGWVISSTKDTVIYLYYENAQPDNISFVGNTWDDVVHNVWNEHYVLVMHMSDAGPPPRDTSRILDSSGPRA